MAEQRMSLEEAGKLLGGLHPNTVRHRAAKGKIPYEKDNSGKWFVFLDPDKLANDAKPRPPKSPPMEPPLEPQIGSVVSTLEATIQTLGKELEATRAERDTLKTRLDERAEVAQRLEVALATITAKHEAAGDEVERLRVRLEQETDENRKLLVGMVEKMAAKAAAEAQERPRGFFGWLTARRA